MDENIYQIAYLLKIQQFISQEASHEVCSVAMVDFFVCTKRDTSLSPLRLVVDPSPPVNFVLVLTSFCSFSL